MVAATDTRGKGEIPTGKKEAKRVVRYARNEEWAELGRSLQDDFQKNQKSIWSRVRTHSESRAV